MANPSDDTNSPGHHQKQPEASNNRDDAPSSDPLRGRTDQIGGASSSPGGAHGRGNRGGNGPPQSWPPRSPMGTTDGGRLKRLKSAEKEPASPGSNPSSASSSGDPSPLPPMGSPKVVGGSKAETVVGRGRPGKQKSAEKGWNKSGPSSSTPSGGSRDTSPLHPPAVTTNDKETLLEGGGSGFPKKRRSSKKEPASAEMAQEPTATRPTRKPANFDSPDVPRSCSLCGKQFKNWKAIFGHMRSHSGRRWKGVFPPPVSPSHTSSPPPKLVEQADEIAATLLNIGVQIAKTIKEGENRDHHQEGTVAASDGRTSSFSVDLNEPAEPSEAAAEERKKIHRKIDLNKDAPQEDGDDK